MGKEICHILFVGVQPGVAIMESLSVLWGCLLSFICYFQDVTLLGLIESWLSAALPC